MTPNFILEKKMKSVSIEDGGTKGGDKDPGMVEASTEGNTTQEPSNVVKKKKSVWSSLFRSKTSSEKKKSLEIPTVIPKTTSTTTMTTTNCTTTSLSSQRSSGSTSSAIITMSSKSSSLVMEIIEGAEEQRWRSINPLIHLPNNPNESIPLLKEIPICKFSWIMEGYSWISEAKSWYIINPYTGKLLFTQTVYNNSGWPMPTSCQSSTRYFDPTKATSSDNQTDWIVIKAKEEGHIFEYFTDSMSKVKISNEKCDIKLTKSSETVVRGGVEVGFSGKTLSFDLKMEENKGISFDDGNVYFGADQGDGILNQKFIIGAPTKGTIKRSSKKEAENEAFDGISLCVHQFQGLRPNLIGSRWNFCNFVGIENAGAGFDTSLTPATAIDPVIWNMFMIQVKTPQAYGNATINKGSIHSSKDGLLSLSTNDTGPSPNYIRTLEPTIDPNTDYYLPKQIEYCWSGFDLQGRPFKAVCHSRPTIMVARINVLEQLPFVFRKVVEALISKPYVYQWLNKVKVDVQYVDGDGESSTKTLDGWLLEEIAIVSEDFRY